MKSGLSLKPYKKAAVTSKSIILNFFADDLRVAALEIKLLAIDSPGVPENRVSRSMASLTNSRASKRAFGLGHSTVPLFVMTHLADSITDSGLSSTSLRSTTSYTPLSEFLQLDLLCFRNLIFRQLWWYLFAFIVRPPRCPPHVPLTVCFRQVEISRILLPRS